MKLNHIYNDYLYEGLDKPSIRSVRLWEHAGIVIKEAALTPDQINQLFQQIEAGATASGSNRTMIGQGKDIAATVNRAWEDLKTKIQNSGPIKGLDAKYDQAAEKLKQATGGDQGVMKYVQKYRDFAKAHPIAQSLIYSALIAAAGISGAGLGGAAALGLFKMVDKLLQGEKFSSAAYAGAKTGATAYAAGQIGKALQGQQAQPLDHQYGTRPGENELVGQTGPGQYASNYSGTAIGGMPVIPGQPLNPTQMALADMSIQNGNKLSPTVQAAYDLAKQQATQESINLSESAIALIIGKVVARQRKLDEGVWDTIKQKAATVGKNLTTKITADKLQSAWKKAGSPTDSDAVANILKQAGVDDAVINKVFGDMQIPAPAAPANQNINIDDIVARIKKLPPADQKKVLAALGTA